MGEDPETGEAITLRKGPYGFYVQAGETKGKQKPKRCSLPKSMDPGEVTLDQALALLSLPRDVGTHPGTGKTIAAGLGRYGPYLRHDGSYTSLGPDEDLLTIGLNRAVTLIDEAPKRGRAKALRSLGNHPEDGKPVEILSGRYGPYVKHGRTKRLASEGRRRRHADRGTRARTPGRARGQGRQVPLESGARREEEGRRRGDRSVSGRPRP